VIGLDGAVLEVLEAFAAHGWMPNLAMLLDEAISCTLRSTLPPISAPAWASFLTGCNPGRTGVFGFRGPSRGSEGRSTVSAASIRSAPVWEVLNAYGLSAGLINVPVTYPPEPLNGYIVSGMMTPHDDRAVAYPEAVQQFLRGQRYVVDLHVGRHERDVRREDQVVSLAEDLAATVRTRGRAAVQLLERHPTDFFALVFVATDRIQHAAWRHVERLVEEPVVSLEDPTCRAVLEVYRELDRQLGELLTRRSSDTTIILMSDHGFQAVHTRVHLNAWLADKGWLSYRQGAQRLRRRAMWMRYLLRRIVPRGILLWGRRRLAVARTIDWSRTWAYAGYGTENVVFLNVAGREPMGIVSHARYGPLRAEIAGALRHMEDRGHGGRVMGEVLEADEAYSGPFVGLAPDIVFDPNGGYEFSPDGSNEGGRLERVTGEGRGIHTSHGMLVMTGAGVRPAGDLTGPSIMDVVPTVLYLLGLPVPAEMDGRVLAGALSREWLGARPPSRESLADRLPIRPGGRARTYSPGDERRVEERLTRMGYLE